MEEILNFYFSFSRVKEQKFDAAGGHKYGTILLIHL